MPEDQIHWYILFENYEQGLALHALLDGEGVPNRIAPAPRSIQGELSCGMSLLIESADLRTAKAVIEAHMAPHYAVVPLAGQIHSHRDKYC